MSGTTALGWEAIPDRVLFDYARRHRVIGLLYAAGNPATRRMFRTWAYGQAHHAARYTAEAERLYSLAQRSSLAFVLFKGPVLARQAWPDPGYRAYDDLDIRCARSDFEPLRKVLLAAGYRPVVADQRLRAHYWHFGWGNTFIHPEGYRVEANHRFFAPHYLGPSVLGLDRPEIFMPVRLDTRDVMAPTPACHLLLSCLHAFWHGGERLAWIADIAGLLARHPEALAQADQWTVRTGFARRALHSGCRLAGRLFGSDLVSRDLPDSVDAAVATWIDQLRSGRDVAVREQRRLHRGMFSRVEHARYTWRRALVPGDGDLRRLRLPPRLGWLYWIYRPLRIGAAGSIRGVAHVRRLPGFGFHDPP